MSVDAVGSSHSFEKQLAQALHASLQPSAPHPSESGDAAKKDALQKDTAKALENADSARGKDEKQDKKEYVKPPIVGKVTTLKEFAKTTYKETDIARVGLEKLDTDFYMQKIIGDGHCFFRATATFLVKKWLTMSGLRRKEFLDFIHTSVEQVSSTPLQAKFNLFEKTLQSLAREECTYADVVYNEAKSNQLVAFLRQLACDYTRMQEKEGNLSIATVIASFPGSPSVKDYLEVMADMESAKNADHLELVALSKMLGLNIRILDVLVIGKGGAILDEHHRVVYNEAKPDDLFLIRRFSHYDLGIKKKVFTFEAQA
jgi:hypothetical protein